MYQRDERSSNVILTDKNIKNYSIKNKPERKQFEAFNHDYLAEYLDMIRYKYYYLIHSNLSIKAVQPDQAGLYHCKNEKNNKLSPVLRLVVQIPVKAKIVSFQKDSFRSKVILNCTYDGFPEPKAQFYRDGHEINDQKTPVLGQRNHSYIILEKQVIYQESFYHCKVSNRWGEDVSTALLVNPSDPLPDKGMNKRFHHLAVYLIFTFFLFPLCFLLESQTLKKTDSLESYLLTGSLVAVLVAALVFCLILIYSRRIKKLSRRGGIFVRSKKQKSNFGFAFYNSTAVEDDTLMDGSNNNLLLNNMLKSIEFTEDRLELGRVIGQGAYGVVVKAEAIGIEKSIKITTVAVKMLKDDADQDQRNSLISEIRMLLFLGKHLNIVNLLGIVTKKKLMAIVEYCRYGNMKVHTQENQFFDSRTIPLV